MLTPSSDSTSTLYNSLFSAISFSSKDNSVRLSGDPLIFRSVKTWLDGFIFCTDLVFLITELLFGDDDDGEVDDLGLALISLLVWKLVRWVVRLIKAVEFDFDRGECTSMFNSEYRIAFGVMILLRWISLADRASENKPGFGNVFDNSFLDFLSGLNID